MWGVHCLLSCRNTCKYNNKYCFELLPIGFIAEPWLFPLADLMLHAWSFSVVVLVSADGNLAPSITRPGAHNRNVVTISTSTLPFKIGAKGRFIWDRDVFDTYHKPDIPNFSPCTCTRSQASTKGKPRYSTQFGI